MVLTVSPDQSCWGDVTVETARADFDQANTVFRDLGFVVNEIRDEGTLNETWVFANGGDEEEFDWYGYWCGTDWNTLREKIAALTALE